MKFNQRCPFVFEVIQILKLTGVCKYAEGELYYTWKGKYKKKPCAE